MWSSASQLTTTVFADAFPVPTPLSSTDEQYLDNSTSYVPDDNANSCTDDGTATTAATSATPATPGSAGKSTISFNDIPGLTSATIYQPTTTITGGYPLVVFVPGRNQVSSSDFYSRYEAATAAQGFIVAGLNYSDNTSYDAISGDAKDIPKAITDLLADTTLQTNLNAAAGVGLIGHSDGAIAVLLAGYANAPDSRVKAIIAADGALQEGVSYDKNGPATLPDAR